MAVNSKRQSFVLFLSAFAFFAIFAPNGHLPPDTAHSVATARSLVERGTWRLSPSPELIGTFRTADGSLYSKYGPGYALQFIPVVWAAEVGCALSGVDYRTAERGLLCFVNAFWAAVFLVLMRSILSGFGYDRKTIQVTLVGTALGSILLPYSKILLIELPIAVLLIGALLLLVREGEWSAGRGLCLGLVVAALYWLKSANLAYGAVIGLFAVYLRCRRRLAPRAFLGFFAGALLPFVPLFLVNAARFGSPFESGYGAEQGLFTTPFLTGFLGLLFSKSKSLFLYSPLVLCAVLAWPAFYKRRPMAALFSLACLVLSLGLHARWHAWYGGWCWGPRLIVPALLLFHLGIAEFVQRIRGRKYHAVLFTLLLLASSWIQVLGITVVYQQIHYFIADPADWNAPHLVVAEKLFRHKAHGRPELYSCAEMGLDCASIQSQPPWNEVVRDGKLDFTDRETYRGLNILWFGLAERTGRPWPALIPVLLFLSSAGLFRSAWRRDPISYISVR